MQGSNTVRPFDQESLHCFMINETHRMLMAALKSRSYKSLQVNRFGEACFLIVNLADERCVFVDRFGKPPKYRHVWQVSNWLEKRFGIPVTEIEVTNFK